MLSLALKNCGSWTCVFDFFVSGWKRLIPHTGDRRFHATPSDVETRKKKEDSILRKFDSTKIQDVQQHER